MSAKGGPARERQGFEDIRSTSSGTQSRPEWFSEARPTAVSYTHLTLPTTAIV